MNEVKKIWSYAAYDKRRYIALTLCGCLVELMEMSTGIIYGSLINMVANGEPLKTVLLYCGLSFAYVLLLCLFRWFVNYQKDKYALCGDLRLKTLYISKLFHTNYNRITGEDSARYINNLSRDVSRVVNGYAYNMSAIIENCVLVIGSFFAVLALNWKLLLTMLGFTVIMGILPLFIKKKLDASMREESNRMKAYLAVLKENLLGVPIIKSFCAEDQCADRIEAEAKTVNIASRKAAFISDCAGGLGTLVREVAIVSLIAMTCWLVFTRDVEVGAVLTVFSVGSAFYSGILGVSAVVTYLFSYKGVRELVEEVLDYPQVEKTCDLQFEDRIEVKGLTFRYDPDDRNVLSNVDLTFEKNKKYLVLGRSGSGKSTLLKIIAGLYRDYEGKLSFDGADYLEYSETDFGEIISLSQQKCYLFSRSFRDNIDFLGENNRETLDYVLQMCRLEEFVSKLKDGLDTVIDEEVNQVSGGEKMRINLARALYRESQILLLDEVTGALDKTTSEIVENNLLGICDKTIVNVCHKFNDSTLPLYDGIYIFEDGRLVESGSFEQIKDSVILSDYRNLEKADAAENNA